MKIVFNNGDFLPILTKVSSVVNNKNTIQVLGDVMFTCRNGAVSLSASDGEIWMSVAVPQASCNVDGKICIEAQSIMKAMRGLGNVDVTLTTDEETNVVKFNYDVGAFELTYDCADDFPSPTDDGKTMADAVVAGENLTTALNKVFFCASINDVRTQLNGVHLVINESGITSEALNSMAFARLHLGVAQCNGDASVVVPRKAASIISGLDMLMRDNNIKLHVTSSMATLSNAGFRLSFRLLEGKFPNCNTLTPKTYTNVAELDTDELLTALKRTAPMASTRSSSAVMHFTDGEMTLTTQDYEFGKKGSETVACKYSGDEFKICVNGERLTEMIRNIDSRSVIIEMTESNKPLVVYNATEAKDVYVSILMPQMMNG